jgi:hypothetical protein
MHDHLPVEPEMRALFRAGALTLTFCRRARLLLHPGKKTVGAAFRSPAKARHLNSTHRA